MVVVVILALVLGIFCGQGLLSQDLIQLISGNSEYILWCLMFSVGISVGTNKEIFQKLRQADIRVLLIPVGVVGGSLLGGVLCSLLNSLTIFQNLSISSGMGWYSLTGVLLNDIYGSAVGSIAFLSNLLREFLTFLTIPLAVKHLNGYAAIALAGATSEDTTLPFLIRHTSAEMIIYSVINGVITSACVPFLIRIFAV